MAARSLGFRTDLMILRMQGSVVAERDGYTLVSSPHNPLHHWGNFLLLDDPPRPRTVGEWVWEFESQFPTADHLALGIDGVDGDAGPEDEIALAGLQVDRDVVLTMPSADALVPPALPHPNAACRELVSDEDWAQAVELQVAGTIAAFDIPETVLTEFTTAAMAAMRDLTEAGHGSWFGGFVDTAVGEQMVTGLGVFTDGSGVARFQTVQTLESMQGQGLATMLVHHAAAAVLTGWGVDSLVMVAEPDEPASGIYRRLGFSGTERMVRLSRPPG